MTSPYAAQIAALVPGFDPRHVEAYMRVEHSTLDGLCPARFREEVAIACACVAEGGTDMAERIAKSFGF